MNPQPDQDLERRLQQLEAELDSPLPPSPREPQQSSQPQTNNPQTVQLQLRRYTNWFNGLSSVGKLLTLGVTVVVGLAIFKVVFNFVASAISVALLGVLLYFAYKFFVARGSQIKD